MQAQNSRRAICSVGPFHSPSSTSAMQPCPGKWWHSCNAKPQTILSLSLVASMNSQNNLQSNLQDNLQDNLIDELESVLASKDISRRAGILRKVTDLFVLGSGKFSEDQIDLFDSVMGRLLENI